MSQGASAVSRLPQDPERDSRSCAAVAATVVLQLKPLYCHPVSDMAEFPGILFEVTGIGRVVRCSCVATTVMPPPLHF